MGHVQASTLGFATPTNLPQTGISWGFAPYGGQPFGIPSVSQQFGQPFSGQAGYGIGAQPLQQILQFLHTVPQQLQQLQVLQQQQLGQVQQLLQLVPAQLQQLQQLIQLGPQQAPFLQQPQPYGAALGFPFSGPGANYVM
jgi:hypothetical protein